MLAGIPQPPRTGPIDDITASSGNINGAVAIWSELPLDIVRIIFETSARAHRPTALQLTLVSRLVRSWIYPILCEVVWLGTWRHADGFVKATPASIFEKIRVLAIAYHVGRAKASKILPLFTHLDGLACWVSDPLKIPSIARLSTPRRLSLNLSGKPTINLQPDFSLPLFRRATHVEFFDESHSWRRWTGFERMPNLTHLSLLWDTDILEFAPSFASQLFRTCAKLQVLVFIRSAICVPDAEYDRSPATRVEGLRLFNNPRIVVINQLPFSERDIRNEWESQWLGEPNVWQTADEIAAFQAAL